MEQRSSAKPTERTEHERVVHDWIAEGYSYNVLKRLLFRNAEAYFNVGNNEAG